MRKSEKGEVKDTRRAGVTQSARGNFHLGATKKMKEKLTDWMICA